MNADAGPDRSCFPRAYRGAAEQRLAQLAGAFVGEKLRLSANRHRDRIIHVMSSNPFDSDDPSVCSTISTRARGPAGVAAA